MKYVHHYSSKTIILKNTILTVLLLLVNTTEAQNTQNKAFRINEDMYVKKNIFVGKALDDEKYFFQVIKIWHGKYHINDTVSNLLADENKYFIIKEALTTWYLKMILQNLTE
ncbi:MAG: hypothetical protein Q4G08_07140 [Capnocytophaga sp.]|nr:hypothetical protein [Capnocytophaga sp.]